MERLDLTGAEVQRRSVAMTVCSRVFMFVRNFFARLNRWGCWIDGDVDVLVNNSFFSEVIWNVIQKFCGYDHEVSVCMYSVPLDLKPQPEGSKEDRRILRLGQGHCRIQEAQARGVREDTILLLPGCRMLQSDQAEKSHGSNVGATTRNAETALKRAKTSKLSSQRATKQRVIRINFPSHA